MRKEKASAVGKVWLKKKIRPYRSRVFFLTCLTIFTTIFSLGFAYLVRYLINSATNQDSDQLWIFAAVVLALVVLKIVLKTLTSYFTERYRAKMVSQLRVEIYSDLLNTEYLALQNYHSGDVLTRLTSDVQEIASTTVGLAPSMVGMFTQCIGAILALLTIDPLFTLIYVICGGIFAGLTALFRKQIKKRHKAVMEADSHFRSYMQESYSSILTVKAYGVEDKTTQKTQSLADTYFDERLKRNNIHALMSLIYGYLSNFGLIFAVVWCSVSVLNGTMNDYGAILSVILLLMQLQQPLSTFSSIIPAYYSRLSSAERLAEMEKLPHDNLTNEKSESSLNPHNFKAIQLMDVSFSYGCERVLERVTLSLEAGKTKCLTGISGTGKSTLFKLLLNVLTPTTGEIFLDTHEARRPLSIDARSLFAYVPQGNFLFSGTIYENLIFFAGNANEKAIEQALRTACADFVFELPDGLQTQLGEKGVGLSEGQMQRLAIARAILCDRPILLLDEATSALDCATEKQLLENVKSLQNKTCLMVTHRPAALEIADVILQLENGEIAVVK